MFSKFTKSTEGNAAVEYGFIAALIGMAIMGSAPSVDAEKNSEAPQISTALFEEER